MNIWTSLNQQTLRSWGGKNGASISYQISHKAAENCAETNWDRDLSEKDDWDESDEHTRYAVAAETTT